MGHQRAHFFFTCSAKPPHPRGVGGGGLCSTGLNAALLCLLGHAYIEPTSAVKSGGHKHIPLCSSPNTDALVGEPISTNLINWDQKNFVNSVTKDYHKSFKVHDLWSRKKTLIHPATRERSKRVRKSALPPALRQ